MGHSARQLRSTVTSEGRLELSLATIEVPDPGPDEVVVRIEASPINPSDLGLLFGPSDMRTAKASGTPEEPAVTADIPSHLLAGVAARLDQSLPVGNEGAGVVVAAGDSEPAQALLGRTVGVIGGAMYSQYRTAKPGQCLAFADGTEPAECASWFVNPLTALFPRPWKIGTSEGLSVPTVLQRRVVVRVTSMASKSMQMVICSTAFGRRPSIDALMPTADHSRTECASP